MALEWLEVDGMTAPLPLGRKRWAEMSDVERWTILEWVIETCLLFGCQRHTALKVAASFAQGLDQELAS